MSDTQSLPLLNLLHPKVRQSAILAYNEAVRITPVGVHPYILETDRSFARQAELYAQGRTKPGPIVTNSKPGQTYHNYKLAIDFANQIKGKISWVVDENWMKVVNCFEAQGWKWGGRWQSFKDYPHFEKTLGYNWKDLLKLHTAGKIDAQGYVII